MIEGKPTALWALVTNSGYGRLLELERSPARITEIGVREGPARHLTSRELVSDASGRDFNAAGPVSHSKQPRTDAHEEAERRFVSGWVDQLQSEISKHRFEHLLLAADPRTLGRLRTAMGKTLQDAVVGESNHDLTQLPLKDLESRLRAIAGWED